MNATIQTPSPALNPSTLYIGDNGRVTCGALRCAGSSAHFTGRGTSGQAVEALTLADLDELKAMVGREPSCESCGMEVAR